MLSLFIVSVDNDKEKEKLTPVHGTGMNVSPSSKYLTQRTVLYYKGLCLLCKCRHTYVYCNLRSPLALLFCLYLGLSAPFRVLKDFLKSHNNVLFHDVEKGRVMVLCYAINKTFHFCHSRSDSFFV